MIDGADRRVIGAGIPVDPSAHPRSYRIPVYDLLEQCGLTVRLDDARQSEAIPGRKSIVFVSEDSTLRLWYAPRLEPVGLPWQEHLDTVWTMPPDVLGVALGKCAPLCPLLKDERRTMGLNDPACPGHMPDLTDEQKKACGSDKRHPGEVTADRLTDDQDEDGDEQLRPGSLWRRGAPMQAKRPWTQPRLPKRT